MVAVIGNSISEGIKGRFNLWAIAAILVAGSFFMPVVAVLATAAGDSGGLWQHLFTTVLPRYVFNTVSLMVGVGVLSILFGVTTAWVVFRYEFCGRQWCQWILLLPAAIPSYLIAYTYTDFLEYAGPVQGLLRNFFGWQSAREYWFPEIRSMGGAIFVMGAVLYPYVYVIARTAFLLTPSSYFEAARIAGRNMFWSVGLPLARPAIVAGVALVMMETISDFGTVEYFAIETLTLGIFNVWLGMNNLAAAAQIATCAFLFIILLLLVETLARAKRRFVDTSRNSVSFLPKALDGWRAGFCMFFCLFPVIVGFVTPVSVLVGFIIEGHSTVLTTAMLDAAANSIVIGCSVASLVVATALFMGLVASFNKNLFVQRLTAISSFGYAFPGTILAVGVVMAGGTLDTHIAKIAKNIFGWEYGGGLTSGVALVIFACVVRFQAVGYGAVKSGLARISESMIEASRVLGHGFGRTMGLVILPMIRLSCVAGGLLVFVDVMKELPMTLLLRPFDFETLATYVYQFAKDEMLEKAALPALAIVVTGVVPVIVMNAALSRFRPLYNSKHQIAS